MKRTFIVAIFALAATSIVGCQGVNLVSRQKDRDIKIDGRLPDWSGVEFVKKADLSFALANDDSCLYVAVIAKDQIVRQQIMISGLYLWFDESGGKNKNFGVCFPIGGMERADSEMTPRGPGSGGYGERSVPPGGADSSGSPPRGAPGSKRPRNGGGPGEGPDSVAAPRPGGPPATVLREMMVYSAKIDEWAKTGKGSLGGVEAAADMGRRALVLELKIPLDRDAATGYGIGVRAGQTVGVGVESPEIKGGNPGSRDGPGGDEFGGPEGEKGGEPGGSGGRGGSGGPGGPAGSGDMGGPEGAGGGEPRRPEAIKVWGTLTLARRAS